MLIRIDLKKTLIRASICLGWGLMFFDRDGMRPLIGAAFVLVGIEMLIEHTVLRTRIPMVIQTLEEVLGNKRPCPAHPDGSCETPPPDVL